MENKKLCLALFSGSLDKLTAAGVILSGAAADDMDIDVYILLQAARAFKKEIASNKDEIKLSENSHLREEFIDSLKNLNVKEWQDFFKEVKEITNAKFHICGLAGKIWGGETLEDFIDISDDIVGISEYITAAEEADIHLFI